jgi:hypothetical protein
MRRPRFLIRAVATAILVVGIATGAASSAAASTPLVRASPASLHFTSGELGHAEAQKVTLTNLTQRHLEIRFLPVPPDAVFTHGHSSCPISLAPHESCSITVWFKPEHWGPATGKLVYVVGHSASTAYQVHLSGEAHPQGEDARLGRR